MALVHKEEPEEGVLDLLDMSEILPGVLYLGSRRAAHSYKALQARKVFDVIAVIIEDQRYRDIKRDEYKYHNIPLADSSNADLARHFARCYDIIEKARSKGTAVLVHCEAGVSRSPTVVMSYLMRSQRIGLLEAYQFVKNRRRFIGPNWGFLKQLWEYETSLFTSPPSYALGALVHEQFAGTFEGISAQQIHDAMSRHNYDVMAAIEDLWEAAEEEKKQKEKAGAV